MMADSHQRGMKRSVRTSFDRYLLANLADCTPMLQFHQRFRGLHPDCGLRRIPDVEQVAAKYGFVLEKRIPMPAGNWMLVFRRPSDEAEV